MYICITSSSFILFLRLFHLRYSNNDTLIWGKIYLILFEISDSKAHFVVKQKIYKIFPIILQCFLHRNILSILADVKSEVLLYDFAFVIRVAICNYFQFRSVFRKHYLIFCVLDA